MMTNNEITKMANEAGFVTGLVANKKPFIWHLFVEDDNLFPEMKLFAKLVANAEREACAKVCDVLAVHPEYASDITKLAAQAIRARR
jgi:hypothetical protein